MPYSGAISGLKYAITKKYQNKYFTPDLYLGIPIKNVYQIYTWLPIVDAFRTLNWVSIKSELQFSGVLNIFPTLNFSI